MHELLGNAPDVNAGSPKAPGCSDGRGLDEVAEGDLPSEVGGLLRGGKASRTSSDDLKK